MPRNYVDNAYNRSVGRVGQPVGSHVISRSSGGGGGGGSLSSGISAGGGRISGAGSSTYSGASGSTKTYVDNAYNRREGRVGLPVGTCVISKSSSGSPRGQVGSASLTGSTKTYVDNEYNRREGRVGLPVGTCVISKSSSGSPRGQVGSASLTGNTKTYVDYEYKRLSCFISKSNSGSPRGQVGSASLTGSTRTYVDNEYNRREGRVGLPVGSCVISKKSTGSSSSTIVGSGSGSGLKGDVGVYTDNPLNRRLGRVGKQKGTCVYSRKDGTISSRTYADNKMNRKLGRVGEPLGSRPVSGKSSTTKEIKKWIDNHTIDKAITMTMEEGSFETKQKIGQLSYTGQQHIEQGAPENAVGCFSEAYHLSRQVGDDHLERTCALNLGAAYIESGNATEGLKVLHKATPPDGEKDGLSNGDLFYNFALGHEALKNMKEAVKYYWQASDEFRTDPDMQMQCLTKCAQLYLTWKNYAKVVEVYERLFNVYKNHNNNVMQASCLCEIAANNRYAQNDELSLKAANEAFQILKGSLDSEDDLAKGRDMAGKIFNDLGLVYTQLQNYDLACSCFENALPLVRAPSENKQLEAVILQNLGASYNFQGEYQRSIKFHEDAADAYAKLKSRNSQGQCFTNLAFAYSQLGNIDDADVAFNHALLASKDSGDKQTRWQALEGLACVKFNQGKYEKAEEFFLDALRLVPEINTEASMRVRQKLSRVMEMKVTYGRGRLPIHLQGQGHLNHTQSQLSGIDAERLHHIEGQIVEEPLIMPKQQGSMYNEGPMQTGEQPFMSSARQVELQQTPAPADDAPKERRLIGIRKKDSIGHRHHPKMMRGLAGTMSSMSNYDSPRYVMHGTGRGSMLDDVEESSSDSEEESSGSDTDSTSEEVDTDTKKDVGDGPKLGPKEQCKSEVLSPVVEEIFRPASETVQSDASGHRQLQSQRTDKEVSQYEKMLQEKEKNEESSEEDSDEDSDDDSDDDSSSSEETSPEKSDNEDEHKVRDERIKAPSLPTQQPTNTTTAGFSSGDVATYMKPLNPQGKPYGTDDMAPYLDSGVTPAFYNTNYTPVPYDDISDGTDTAEPSERPFGAADRNLRFSSSGDATDPKALYTTVDKANKLKDTTRERQNITNGLPDIHVDRTRESKEKREKSGNFFNSDDSLSGDDIDVAKKMKEVASNMSLRGSIQQISRDDDDADPYASIKDVTRETGGIQFTPGGADHRSKGIDEMPRSQREAILGAEHVRRSELGPPLPERQKQGKESKTCTIM